MTLTTSMGRYVLKPCGNSGTLLNELLVLIYNIYKTSAKLDLKTLPTYPLVGLDQVGVDDIDVYALERSDNTGTLPN